MSEDAYTTITQLRAVIEEKDERILALQGELARYEARGILLQPGDRAWLSTPAGVQEIAIPSDLMTESGI